MSTVNYTSGEKEPIGFYVKDATVTVGADKGLSLGIVGIDAEGKEIVRVYDMARIEEPIMNDKITKKELLKSVDALCAGATWQDDEIEQLKARVGKLEARASDLIESRAVMSEQYDEEIAKLTTRMRKLEAPCACAGQPMSEAPSPAAQAYDEAWERGIFSLPLDSPSAKPSRAAKKYIKLMNTLWEIVHKDDAFVVASSLEHDEIVNYLTGKLRGRDAATWQEIIDLLLNEMLMLP